MAAGLSDSFSSQPSRDLHRRLERERLAALSERYRPILLRFFERRVRPREDVEDLVQEVFLRLLRRVDLQAVEHIQGYLFEVAANVIRDRARHGAARGAGLHDEFREDRARLEDFSPERVLIGRQTVGHIARSLYELPERTRMAFVLHRFEGLRHPEIARRLGVSVSSVEKYIINALVHLRRRMEEDS